MSLAMSLVMLAGASAASVAPRGMSNLTDEPLTLNGVDSEAPSPDSHERGLLFGSSPGLMGLLGGLDSSSSCRAEDPAHPGKPIVARAFHRDKGPTRPGCGRYNLYRSDGPSCMWGFEPTECHCDHDCEWPDDFKWCFAYGGNYGVKGKSPEVRAAYEGISVPEIWGDTFNYIACDCKANEMVHYRWQKVGLFGEWHDASYCTLSPSKQCGGACSDDLLEGLYDGMVGKCLNKFKDQNKFLQSDLDFCTLLGTGQCPKTMGSSCNDEGALMYYTERGKKPENRNDCEDWAVDQWLNPGKGFKCAV